MSDFHSAGGMLALLHTLRPLLCLGARTITGETLGERLDSAYELVTGVDVHAGVTIGEATHLRRTVFRAPMSVKSRTRRRHQ